MIHTVYMQSDINTKYSKYSRYKTIGKYEGTFAADDKKVISLHLPSDEKCPTDAAQTLSSVILFQCDEREQTPVYDGMFNCTNYFRWQTSVVCEAPAEPCVAFDYNTGFRYDFRSLSGKSYSVNRNNETYTFGICNAPKGCLENSGACTSKQSLGLLNDNLKFNTTGTPSLTYTDGAICRTGGKKWYTQIDFSCATEQNEDNTAKLLEDTDCRLIIEFATRLACPSNISCEAVSGITKFDLSPLIRSDANYEATISEALMKSENNTNVKVS